MVSIYRRGDELRDALVENLVPLPGVAVLCDEELEERIRPVVEALALEFLGPDGVLIVRKALDAEHMPRRKGIKHKALLRTAASRAHPQRLGGLAPEGQGQHGAALGNVDVVDVRLLGGPLVVALPGGGLEALADDGVVLEDEEEGALAEVGEGIRCRGRGLGEDSGL